ncbi:hypothetical protein [Sinomonas soli]
MTQALPSHDPYGPPPAWVPPRWLSQRPKRVCQHIAALLAARVQALECEAENLRRKLAAAEAEVQVYRQSERNR